ncbi:hypothetical protein JCM14469_27710 [Desulfatiferula olefinivorans]
MNDSKRQQEERASARAGKRSAYQLKKMRAQAIPCHCCGVRDTFCWRCRCGFAMCQSCMDENFWGVTCNGITWDCPDCGAQNGFGNQ